MPQPTDMFSIAKLSKMVRSTLCVDPELISMHVNPHRTLARPANFAIGPWQGSQKSDVTWYTKIVVTNAVTNVTRPWWHHLPMMRPLARRLPAQEKRYLLANKKGKKKKTSIVSLSHLIANWTSISSTVMLVSCGNSGTKSALQLPCNDMLFRSPPQCRGAAQPYTFIEKLTTQV